MLVTIPIKGPVNTILLWIAVLAALCYTLCAQDTPNDNPKINTNFGLALPVAVNPTAQFATIGAGIDAGIGYNFSRVHGAVAEFMWSRLASTPEALETLRSVSQNNAIAGNSDLYAFTGNYRFELRGKRLGTYLIGGGGWYRHTTNLSPVATSGSSTPCAPVWIWWGFTCTSGTVTPNQTILSASSSAFGANGGIGFTARIGEAPYRLYFESRYHYAPTKNITTAVVVVGVGIRY